MTGVGYGVLHSHIVYDPSVLILASMAIATLVPDPSKGCAYLESTGIAFLDAASIHGGGPIAYFNLKAVLIECTQLHVMFRFEVVLYMWRHMRI